MLKRMVRRVGFGAGMFGLVVGVGLLGGAAAYAESPGATAAPTTPAADLPAGKDLIEKYIEASGGREAYKGITSRTSKGTFEVAAMGLKGTFEMVQAAPNKGLMTIDLPGLGKIARGSDGETLWENSAMTGARILEGVEREEGLRQFMLDADVNWEKFFKSAETVAVEDVGGKPAYKVKLVSATNGDVSHFFYDKETGLLRQMEMRVQTQMGPIDVKATVEGYKEFDGIKIPTVTTQEMAGAQQTITITSIEHNKPVDVQVFALPADIVALKNKAPAPKPN